MNSISHPSFQKCAGFLLASTFMLNEAVFQPKPFPYHPWDWSMYLHGYHKNPPCHGSVNIPVPWMVMGLGPFFLQKKNKNQRLILLTAINSDDSESAPPFDALVSWYSQFCPVDVTRVGGSRLGRTLNMVRFYLLVELPTHLKSILYRQNGFIFPKKWGWT